ncbi:hypothetical protein B0A55_12031 [Friedmanniomyces simplex]|uniref:RING-type E3 ubiquitin transferase n=1 Tax=Friedmanniomyces simplex TaxID=329884 RepID=A0A4U0WPR2_9PEZI|nr:hypothetical protein B0A55_12031 [Friedmanniomyces simplex]
MDSIRRICLLATALLLLLLSTATAQTVTAQNASTQSTRQQSYSLTLAVSIGDTMVPLAQIIALTRSAALDMPPPGISGQALLANATNQLTIQHSTVALLSCDDAAYAGNIHALDVFATAETAVAAAVVWYSTQSDWCDLEEGDAGSAYSWVYSMKSLNDTRKMLDSLGGGGSSSSSSSSSGHATQGDGNGNVYVTIAPPDNAAAAAAAASNGSNQTSSQQQQQQDNSPLGPSPGTAVAMIILYSITGIITALFLVIIVTGAVRAHRHPERYGPRNIIGRARQSRARGLARAMLETIPIVKFGEREEPKPTDVELADGSGAGEATSQGSDAQAGPHAAAGTTAEDSALTDQEPAAGRRSSAGGIAAAASNAQHIHDQENQGCSICTEDFEVGQDQRVLPCDHRFHPDCIDPWLLNVSGTCPLCRIDLRPQISSEEAEEQVDEHGNPVPRAEGVEGLPPPLGQEGRERTGVRRSVMMGLMGIRRPDRMTREERVDALRRYRVQQAAEMVRRRRERGVGGSSTATVAGSDGQQDESGLRTRLRNAFRIRTTRRTGVEEGGGGGATAAAAAIPDTPARDGEAG